jgi:nitrogen fixation protein NifB
MDRVQREVEENVSSLASVIIRQHPCFDEQAHREMGRIHLAVAPRCNIRCRFCERRVCANLTMQHPGWARRLLTPQEAVERVRRLAQERMGGFVVGIAGPGEPLANEETFEALQLVHRAFPELTKCISTNGLLLERELHRLIEAGIVALTVTVNAVDSAVGEQIYAWVRHEGVLYRGREAAEILLDSQVRGIQAALSAGLAVKANTVLIPGVNDGHVRAVARRLQELGVHRMNIMPLIPGGQMRDRRAPSCEELGRARSECAPLIPQIWHCEQCRADVIRFPR